jgi:hypothetical protein
MQEKTLLSCPLRQKSYTKLVKVTEANISAFKNKPVL